MVPHCKLQFIYQLNIEHYMIVFVRSNEAACTRRLDEGGSPPIDPDYSAIKAPSMNEQCQRRLKDPRAFVPEVTIFLHWY